MSTQNPLIVPMTVEALVVNDIFRTNGSSFVRNQMLYGAMSTCNSGQPGISNNDTQFTLHSTSPVLPSKTPAGDYYNGVYLKWRLPESFTNGVQDNVTGLTEYPLVPNRWLVVRYSGPLTQRVATAWIVESDHVYPNNQVPQPTNASMVATAYVKANSNGTPTQQFIGQNILLGSWTESGNDLQLTAMAPGNPAFGVFQPQNNNVFSFIDCLNSSPTETLSYMVTGWFSNPESDPLYEKLAVWTNNTGNNVVSTLNFSAASASQVNWTAGTITIAGTVYNIVAGNTGAMSATTYVYLDPMVSTTALQITTDLATAQAGIPIVTATPFFAAQLSTLGWTLPENTDPALTATWSMLYGAVNGVQWQNTALPPGGVPSASTGAPPVSVAVGNTSVEALTAMITAQAAQQNIPIDAELLEAFQLDLTEVFDMPDGAAVLAEKLQASFFQKFSGGYNWNIVDAPDSTTQISQAELQTELAWLATLNQDQENLNEALNELASLQSQLYTMWWKYADWPNAIQQDCGVPGLETQAGLQQQLDPTVSGSLAQLTASQMTKVNALMALVPTGDTQAELAQAILDYSTQKNLPATRLLKRTIAPLFYKPNNPVVMIAGAGVSGLIQNDNSSLLCRFPSQVVTGFNYNSKPVTAATSGLSIPQPNLSQVTGAPWSAALLNSLVGEFFFLDTNNATVIGAAISASASDVQTAMSDSANDIGVYPTGAVEQWTENPWHPLLMYWQLNYYPIEFGTPSSPNWSFDNGQFFWNGSPSSVVKTNTYTYSSMIQLTPMANFNMQSRINAFLANNPDLDPLEKAEFEALLDFVQTSDHWDLLSQAMDGFNEQMQLGLPGVFMTPASYPSGTTPSLSTLIGHETGYPPSLGNIPSSTPYPPSGFLPLRAGQFEFIQLVLIDEWGQALWPIDSYNYKTVSVYMPPELTPVQSSEAVNFTVSSTVAISSISPEIAPTGGSGITLTVNGVNFTNAATIEWNGTAISTSFVSSTQLTASLSTAQLQSQGSYTVTVSLGGGINSNALPFTVASGPTIGSLSPNLLQAGMVPSSTFTLFVTGVGFTAGSLVQWNGIALSTEFVSSFSLIATVPANYAFAPGIANITVSSGGTVSNTAVFTLSPGSAIVSLEPAIASTSTAGFTLTVNGVGFEPGTLVAWNKAALATTYVSATQLTALVPASLLSQAGTMSITASIGSCVFPNVPDSFIQLPPALLQPAQLSFNLISAVNDSIVFGPVNPTADPICGWVLPNHLDHSIMAYDPLGVSLGEMSIDITGSDALAICWMPSPGSPYTTLTEIASSIPHFGNFLLTLSQQTTDTFTAFMAAIDDTLWTTAPMGTSFDQSLAVLMGRPLAMVRANLQFLLDGPAVTDPSWQFTFDPAAAQVETYKFPIELGNIAQLKDGLIGYFVEDAYGTFNVVTESGATESNYLNPIGVDNNYIYLPFDGTTSTFVSMLVDPYAAVHATTGILPVTSVSLPPEFTVNAIAAMNVTFRMDGILTDQQVNSDGSTTILLPVPNEKSGVWQWIENDEGTWTNYTTGPNDTSARLSDVPPVLRRGFLQLNSGLSS